MQSFSQKGLYSVPHGAKHLAHAAVPCGEVSGQRQRAYFLAWRATQVIGADDWIGPVQASGRVHRMNFFRHTGRSVACFHSILPMFGSASPAPQTEYVAGAGLSAAGERRLMPPTERLRTCHR